MSSKLILWLIVAVVVIGGGVWYLGMPQGGVVNQEGEVENDSQDSQARKITGSIEDLLAEGESYRCNFVYESDLADSTGVVYVSGGKLKGDFETEVSALGRKVVTHLIRDGASVYTWIDGTDIGVKAPATISRTDSSVGLSGQAS
ncbi:MAG: hypothetical protein KGZ30_02240, partial [Anaplasmataceae bacterium]|nr:hypothetical protein [Anaplasmataceae bacterium]